VQYQEYLLNKIIEMKKMTLIHVAIFAAGAALGYFICKKQKK
jgi:hypothetical protein